jgi:hypothetical protein
MRRSLGYWVFGIGVLSLLWQCKVRQTSSIKDDGGVESSAETTVPPSYDAVLKAREFTECLKTHPKYDVAGAVNCLPRGCSFEFVRSASLQTSCSMQLAAGCGAGNSNQQWDLPRVIARCDNRALSVTWSFCIGGDHVEVSVPDAGGGIYLWDISLPLVNEQHLEPMTRAGRGESCDTCHFREDRDPYSFAPFPTGKKELIANGAEYFVKLCQSLEAVRGEKSCELSYDSTGATKAVSLDRNIRLCRILMDYIRPRLAR